MIQWVRVEHGRVRDVFIDGVRSGQTNHLIAVSEGTHRFDLGDPVNYKPGFRRIAVTGTTRLVPCIVAFQP
jgi:hypothetical protein